MSLDGESKESSVAVSVALNKKVRFISVYFDLFFPELDTEYIKLIPAQRFPFIFSMVFAVK